MGLFHCFQSSVMQGTSAKSMLEDLGEPLAFYLLFLPSNANDMYSDVETVVQGTFIFEDLHRFFLNSNYMDCDFLFTG